MKDLFSINIYESTSSEEDFLDVNINEDTTIPVPGGDKETPGDGGIEISADEYNSALSLLKKSYKESYDVIGMLQKVKVK